jgi:uncharacterized tellurite resistance protein B-like protein
MSDPIEAIARALEAFDSRLATIELRFVAVEGHLADAAHHADEHSKSLKSIQEGFVAMDGKLDNNIAIMQNYIKETRALREVTRNLHSEVREKLKVVSGG